MAEIVSTSFLADIPGNSVASEVVELTGFDRVAFKCHSCGAWVERKPAINPIADWRWDCDQCGSCQEGKENE